MSELLDPILKLAESEEWSGALNALKTLPFERLSPADSGMAFAIKLAALAATGKRDVAKEGLSKIPKALQRDAIFAEHFCSTATDCGQAALAARYARKVEDKFEHTPGFLCAHSQAQLGLCDFDEAESLLEQALLLDPHHPQALRQKVQLLHPDFEIAGIHLHELPKPSVDVANDIEDALTVILEMTPDDFQAKIRLAFLRQSCGENEIATANYATASRILAPNFLLLRLWLSAAVRSGNRELLADTLKALQAFPPDPEHPLVIEALSLGVQGKSAEALAVASKALSAVAEQDPAASIMKGAENADNEAALVELMKSRATVLWTLEILLNVAEICTSKALLDETCQQFIKHGEWPKPALAALRRNAGPKSENLWCFRVELEGKFQRDAEMSSFRVDEVFATDAIEAARAALLFEARYGCGDATAVSILRNSQDDPQDEWPGVALRGLEVMKARLGLDDEDDEDDEDDDDAFDDEFFDEVENEDEDEDEDEDE